MLSLLSDCLPSNTKLCQFNEAETQGTAHLLAYVLITNIKNIYSNILFLKVAPGQCCGRTGLPLWFCPQRLGEFS